MAINIDEKNLKHGVLGLVIALVEVIRDTLKVQAFKRMEGGSLSEEECERLAKPCWNWTSLLKKSKSSRALSSQFRQ